MLARIHFDAGRVDEASREIARELVLVPFSKEALQLKDRIEGTHVHEPVEMSEPIVPTAPAPLASTNRPDIDAAIRVKDWERAERLLAEEIERQPAGQSRELLILIARVFVLDGKPLNTAVALKKADAISPLDRDLRFTLALAYVRLGHADWARPELEKLVQSDPGAAEYRYWLGRLDYDAGQYASAIARFNEALARDATFMRAQDNLGLCYEALNDADQAIVHYREAIRLNRQAQTKSPWPATNLGILLVQRGALEEAGALFREAIGYDSSFANAHYQLGKLLEQQGQNDQAVDTLKRAAALDPAYPEPHYVLARIYRRLGQTAQADEALATFVRLRAAREQRQK
jgi:tetratricopeptide (TPR) repeat protein